MENLKPTMITVETTVHAPVEKTWSYFTDPHHITQWCQASADWHAPYADNDLQAGGKFKTTMAAKDGSFSFDFEGVYTKVEEYKTIEYVIADGRKVKVDFIPEGNETKVVEHFEAESMNEPEMQKQGWQAILESFQKYTEQSE